MTDKQIIIDGVDVSGCDFYDKNKKYCLTLKMDTKGFKNPSCFSGDFQECIQDSKVCPYTFCDNNPNCYYKQLKRKEQECEELKKDKFYLEREVMQLEKDVKDLNYFAIKLKQTLTEIKEIAERDKEFCIKCNGNKEIDCVDCIEGGRALLAKDILQKISECEVE